MRSRIDARHRRLDVELAEQPLSIVMNPIGVEQIVVNLLQNAVDSRTKGMAIRLTTRHQGDRVVLRVSDDGPGIESSAPDRVFDPFYTTRLDDGGTGFGLSVVHGLVKPHAGEFKIESAPGEGTSVVVTFPAYGAEPPG